MAEDKASVGIVGGTGLYSLLEKAEELDILTPYGRPSTTISLGEMSGVKVAFLPRHGRRHEYPPHKIPYLANVWAMHSLGVRRMLGPCAVGSLQPNIQPGDFVLCDQFVNFTRGRKDTFYDGPPTVHISSADPYCPELRRVIIDASRAMGLRTHERGTVVVIEGPRFSTRAESNFFRERGWDVINMTQYPECALARELEVCYANISLVTDYDTGLQGRPDVRPVTQAEVIRVFNENIEKLRRLMAEFVPKIPVKRGCSCAETLKHARVEG